MTLTDQERIRFAAHCRERANENDSLAKIVTDVRMQRIMLSRAVAYAIVADDIDSRDVVRLDATEDDHA